MSVNYDLLSLIGQDTQLQKVSSRKGGEYAGPCPFCGGTDRFHVWPEADPPDWRCLGSKAGRAGCGRGGDAIAYLVERGDLTPKEAGELRRNEGSLPALGSLPRRDGAAPAAPEPLAPPGPDWQAAALAFAERCTAYLWAAEGERAWAWLEGRGLAEATIRAAGLGYNPTPQGATASEWATWGQQRVRLFRGIVVPWMIGDDLWRVNIRRPAGSPKYYSPAGAGNALYNADALGGGKPAILVEGEFDALVLAQVAGDLATPVALGSTTGARRSRWIAILAGCPQVLVALDADPDPTKGDRAAAWWVDVLPNARRLRPWWGDANAMHQDGADLRAWISAGLAEQAAATETHALDPKTAQKLAEARQFAAEAEDHGLPCGDAPSWGKWLAGVEAELLATAPTEASRPVALGAGAVQTAVQAALPALGGPEMSTASQDDSRAVATNEKGAKSANPGPETPLEGHATQATEDRPAWASELPIPLEEWVSFKERHGLADARITWPEGAAGMQIELGTIDNN